jgi:uncharacterized caspase-like protein
MFMPGRFRAREGDRPMIKTSFILSLCLILLSGVEASLSSAAAQQQEKRIALVVGDGAYAKSPLATAANDAGLIAQTLQAAGFDVVGARDLDGDTLRRSFRDFVQKAQTSGEGTIAMVYLAGYGIQLAGENYFIPVDTPLSRDTEIPIEGLRISDYLRELGSLPLKASIFVLDAARQQPFIEGGQPIAGGLALVEPQARMLIAFNAAPGTVAPEEQGPYGAYAQSLAEMIRTGGLPLPEVFNRLRLRVNESTKGAQIPWDAEKLDAQFAFFDRAPDAPVQAPPDQAAEVRNKPIRDLGVQDAYAAALERDTLQGYEDFIVAYPGDPLARRVRAIVAARREAVTWLRSYRADTPQAYWSYLRRYQNGPHAWDARRRLLILSAPVEPPPSFAAYDYDVPPPPPDEFAYVDRPVLMYGDPDFGFVPPPPPPVFFLPPPPPDFIVLAPPIAAVGLFILPQPFFVPIPVYVRPPIYVAPPPNNIIFANIHNTTVINNVINQPPQPGPAGPGGAKGPPGAGGAPPSAASPGLPPSVAQKASLIQQGKLPVPPSASINPAIKPAALGAPSGAGPTSGKPLSTNVSPDALPKTNALPVPGQKGAPPLPSGAAPTTSSPNLKLAPATTSPAASTPNVPPSAAAPKTPGAETPAMRDRRTGGAATTPGAKPVVPESTQRKNVATPAPPPPPPPPKPEVGRVGPPPQAARPTPPPPPKPAPQVARPAPPPPPPKPAPQVARPAPPPPPPRAAPPPPRPAPAAAAAKKCPPNNPKC